jgi:hypothetical protein
MAVHLPLLGTNGIVDSPNPDSSKSSFVANITEASMAQEDVDFILAFFEEGCHISDLRGLEVNRRGLIHCIKLLGKGIYWFS